MGSAAAFSSSSTTTTTTTTKRQHRRLFPVRRNRHGITYDTPHTESLVGLFTRRHRHPSPCILLAHTLVSADQRVVVFGCLPRRPHPTPARSGHSAKKLRGSGWAHVRTMLRATWPPPFFVGSALRRGITTHETTSCLFTAAMEVCEIVGNW